MRLFQLIEDLLHSFVERQCKETPAMEPIVRRRLHAEEHQFLGNGIQ